MASRPRRAEDDDVVESRQRRKDVDHVAALHPRRTGDDHVATPRPRRTDDDHVVASRPRQTSSSGRNNLNTTTTPPVTAKQSYRAQASKNKDGFRSNTEMDTVEKIQAEHIRNFDSSMARRIGSVESDVQELKQELKTGFSEMKDMFSRFVQGIRRDEKPVSGKVPSVSSVIQTGSQSEGAQGSQNSCVTATMINRIPHFEITFNKSTLR